MWQEEFTKLSLQNKARSERVLDLESLSEDLQMKLNEQVFKNKKSKNEIQMLNSAMVEYGYGF